MSNLAMRRRRCRPLTLTYWTARVLPRHDRRFNHVTRAGYGMGRGAHTLIHKGGKP